MPYCTCPRGIDYPGCCSRKLPDEWWETTHTFEELEYTDWTRDTDMAFRHIERSMKEPTFISLTIKRLKRE